MRKDKIKFKLSREELNVLFRYVEIASRTRYNTMEGKMKTSLIISLYTRLHNPWSFPTEVNKVSIPAAEALAFWIVFSGADFQDPFELVTMKRILDEIHKLYA